MEKSEKQPAAAWTFMVYMAGDNDLEDFTSKDLIEMKEAGSTAEVSILAQQDRLSDSLTRRFYLRRGTSLADDVVEECKETNTGDPASLVDFVTWAMDRYPARRYALVLWNHGSGWKEDDVYQAAERAGTQQRVTRSVMRGIADRKKRSLFRASLDWFVENPDRAIAYDDSSEDFLDNAELKKALAQICERSGAAIDLLGFDACLMNMLEVHYQVRGQAGVIVGSQELEPGDGWPYHTLLGALTTQPEMTAETLSKIIVDTYTDFYTQNFPDVPVTQSAVATARLGALVSAVDGLAKSLMAVKSDRRLGGLIYAACRSAQKFNDPDYFDLADLCRALIKTDSRGTVGRAAKAVAEIITGPQTPLIAARLNGRKVRAATGISIYLPARDLSPLYQKLDFAQASAWNSFLNRFLGGQELDA